MTHIIWVISYDIKLKGLESRTARLKNLVPIRVGRSLFQGKRTMILNYFLSSIPRRSPFRSVFVSWLNWQSGRSIVHPRSANCCSVGLNGISGLGFSSFCLFRRRFRSRRLPPRPPRFRRPAFQKSDNYQIKIIPESWRSVVPWSWYLIIFLQ